MTEPDLQRIISWIDSALELFHVHEGQLSAREVRILSILAVARQELIQEVTHKHNEAADGL